MPFFKVFEKNKYIANLYLENEVTQEDNSLNWLYFYENQEYQIKLEFNNSDASQELSLKNTNLFQKNIIREIFPDSKTYMISFYSFTNNSCFNYAGASYFKFTNNLISFIDESGKHCNQLQMFVIPQKLFSPTEIITRDKSQTKIVNLQNVVSSECFALILSCSNPVYFEFNRNVGGGKSLLYHDFLFLKQVFLTNKKLQNAFISIKKNPHKKRDTEISKHYVWEKSFSNNKEIISCVTGSGELGKLTNNHSLTTTKVASKMHTANYFYFPFKLLTEDNIHSNDTLENRFVKNIIKLCLKKISAISAMQNFDDSFVSDYTADLAQLQDLVAKIYRDDFFSDIGELNQSFLSSTVLTRRADYREFLNLFFLLRSSNLIFPDATKIENHDIAYLFELYGFFLIKKILNDIILKFQINTIHYNDYNYLDMKIAIKDEHIYINYAMGSITITLNYQKTYNTYSNIQFRPDITLEINLKNQTHIYIFDPKYRVYNSNNHFEIIKTLHAYKDGICNDSVIVKGVYALVPPIWNNKHCLIYENNNLEIGIIQIDIEQNNVQDNLIELISSLIKQELDH